MCVFSNHRKKNKNKNKKNHSRYYVPVAIYCNCNFLYNSTMTPLYDSTIRLHPRCIQVVYGGVHNLAQNLYLFWIPTSYIATSITTYTNFGQMADMTRNSIRIRTVGIPINPICRLRIWNFPEQRRDIKRGKSHSSCGASRASAGGPGRYRLVHIRNFSNLKGNGY